MRLQRACVYRLGGIFAVAVNWVKCDEVMKLSGLMGMLGRVLLLWFGRVLRCLKYNIGVFVVNCLLEKGIGWGVNNGEVRVMRLRTMGSPVANV